MTRPYYHKKHRNNNRKIVVIICLVSVMVFGLTMVFYPQIHTQTSKIQTSLNSASDSITNSFSDTSNNDAITIASQIHDLVNQQRVQHGLSPLAWNDNNARIAQDHSNEMLTNDDFGHGGLTDRLTAMGCPLGSENVEILKGYYNDQIAKATINDWMSSFGHRANLLNGKFTFEGIGIAQDGSKTLITQDFC